MRAISRAPAHSLYVLFGEYDLRMRAISRSGTITSSIPAGEYDLRMRAISRCSLDRVVVIFGECDLRMRAVSMWKRAVGAVAGVIALFKGNASLGSGEAELPYLPDTPWDVRKNLGYGDCFNWKGIRWRVVRSVKKMYVPDDPYTMDDFCRLNPHIDTTPTIRE